MKKFFKCFAAGLTVLSFGMLSACSLSEFVNPGDSLGGGTESSYTPTETDSSGTENSAVEAAGETDGGSSSVPDGATQITAGCTIDESGDYYVSTTISGKKISVTAEGVTLYLSGATLSNEKKVIESTCDLTITLIGENTVTNSNESGSNAIDVTGLLTINGSGSLTVNSTKNGISADSVSIKNATLTINSDKDGIHTEVSAYDADTVTTEPELSYDDGGYVKIDDATVTIDSASDGIQADTFVYITGDSSVDITTNGGAPTNVTESSSDKADGKGIKIGPADWGAEDGNGDRTEFSGGEYLFMMDGGELTINSNDDAIHTDYGVAISGGVINITSGDDGIHGDEYIDISDGEIYITKCYEGIEAAKIEISGGEIEVTAVDDGVNAADGTENAVNVANNNCHIIISGGNLYVEASGDGIDSNGSILISGGCVYVAGPTNGSDAALDSDGTILVNGGYLFAVGYLGMVETPSTSSAQYCVSFARSTAMSAGTVLSLTDSSGNVIFAFTSPKSCQSVIISCPELEKGSSYCIYGGDTKLTSFTVSSIITTVGSSSSINTPGGMPGGNMGGGGMWR